MGQTEQTKDFYVKFWGVRGSIACPGPETYRYGGNTSCLEVRCGEDVLVFDAGTGIRQLGQALWQEGKNEFNLFFTHLHLDHINGLPFVTHAYQKNAKIDFWAGNLNGEYTVQQLLETLIIPPFFPVPVELFGANIRYHDFTYGAELSPKPGIKIITKPLNHPNGSTGYRIEFNGQSICYVTDTEHKIGELDQNILELIKDADIVIYDSTYTDEEYPRFKGWGHSTWQEGVRLCQAAKAKKLVIFHHDPSHNDEFMDKVAKEAAAAFQGAIVAQEGMILRP